VFRCLEENYLGKDAPKLNTVFFDIEVDFDPERGYSTTDDPFHAHHGHNLLSQLDRSTGHFRSASQDTEYVWCQIGHRTF
jgi:hypothetical protein